MFRNCWRFAVLSLVAVLGVVGSGRFGGFAARAETAAPAVTIDNFSFTPQTLTVKAGTTITWTNRDDIPHTVVSTDSVFKSKPLDTDDKFTFTPTKPGTYEYFCSIHPKMTGKVVVE